MSKMVEYVGCLQVLKDHLKEKWTELRTGVPSTYSPSSEEERRESNFRERVKGKVEKFKRQSVRRIDRVSSVDEDFSHLKRPKTRKELLQISAAVMGIEFAYAAETAFVSPLLLNIGLRHRHMTLMWCLSPLVGFFLTPLLGSVSDGCKSPLGRRRPFILLLSIGIILGLLLVPNGKLIGRWFGDTYKSDLKTNPNPNINSRELNITNRLGKLSPMEVEKESPQQGKSGFFSKYRENWNKNKLQMDENENEKGSGKKKKLLKAEGKGLLGPLALHTSLISDEKGPDNATTTDEGNLSNHPWSLVFTVLGTVLLDFDADACQSPARAYMLDVTIPEDHARGLSTFTVMAGLGGSLGYVLGALDWENTFLGDFFGGQVRAVFTLVLFIFVGCVVTTIRSFREIPLHKLWLSENGQGNVGFAPDPISKPCTKPCKSYTKFQNEGPSYGTLSRSLSTPQLPLQETSFSSSTTTPTSVTGAGEIAPSHPPEETSDKIPPTFKEYLKTIVQLPSSLQWLCLTNFFCWMSLVCYSLYFTDFVGEAVFKGDPTAEKGTERRRLYDDGVRFGCWGMSLYSLSCSIYSLGIEELVNRFGAKRVYITGQLVYSVGMVLMAWARHPVGVILFSWTAGIMYATLFTMPYLLVARYHAAETFDVDIDDMSEKPVQLRGLGTDVAIVSSMVFLAQMTQAVILGSVVTYVGSTTAIIIAAALFALCGALAASKVLYLDL